MAHYVMCTVYVTASARSPPSVSLTVSTEQAACLNTLGDRVTCPSRASGRAMENMRLSESNGALLVNGGIEPSL
eukprot:54750-Eustigmatos_ZCMA.PRE.1